MFSNRRSQIQQRYLRVGVVFIFVLLCFGILLYRLFVLQVVRYPTYLQRADSNRITYTLIIPKRGDIYDRKGRPLAYSQRDYVLEIVPAEVSDFSVLIETLKKYIPISDFELRRFKRRRYAGRLYDSILLKTNLTEEQAAKFSTHALFFPGVYLRARWLRIYPQGETAAHVVGYVGRLSEKDQERLEQEGLSSEYRGTTEIGKNGIEAYYEKTLHGKVGWQKVEVDSSGRLVRVLSRQDPIPGDDLYLSIDLDLQSTVEQLFEKANERGALVALEPNTGQVLAYVSVPSYDPNLFIDGIDEDNWARLRDDPKHPLLNRPISATFPLGSTYKPFVGLAAMYYKVRDPYAYEKDVGYFEFAHQRFRNAGGVAYGATNMNKAITVSSDTYFFSLGPLLGVDRIHDFAQQFGFGQKTGIDLLYEKKGVLPSKEWKKKAFKNPKHQKWYPGETISIAVGQGYNALTIMQLAQATATLASDGKYYTPHLLNFTYNDFLKRKSKTPVELSHTIDLNKNELALMKKALINVTQSGTARTAFLGANYVSAGKTGTAQVFSLKGSQYKEELLKKELKDHALYMGYAPAKNPKIALALIVEHGGWGAKVAAPIARQVFDYWLDNQQIKDFELKQESPPLVDDSRFEQGPSVSPDVETPEQVILNPDDVQDADNPEVIGRKDSDSTGVGK